MTERDSDIPETAAARPAQTAPVVAVVLAAGFGTRFDPDNPKQLVSVGGKPIVEQSSIEGSIDALDQFTAATVAYASTDTVLLTEDLGDVKVVKSVPDRPNTFRAQTPQSFRFATIRRAYELAASDPDFHPTDDTRTICLTSRLPSCPAARRISKSPRWKMCPPPNISPRKFRDAIPRKRRAPACMRSSPKPQARCADLPKPVKRY